jgi:hypothetical protein
MKRGITMPRTKGEEGATAVAEKDEKDDVSATPTLPVKKKEELYRHLSEKLNAKVQEYFKPVADRVAEKTNIKDLKLRQVFSDADMRDLLVDYMRGLFGILTQPGENGALDEASVGIPAGFGSIQLTTAGATKKKTPQGKMVDVPLRWRIRYSAGKTVEGLLKTLPAPTHDANAAVKNGAKEVQPKPEKAAAASKA